MNSHQDQPVRIIAVSSLSDVKIIMVDTIVYFQSQGRYTLINRKDGEEIVSCKNIGFYQKLLANNNNFFRIHHSFLVNVDLSLNIQRKEGLYLNIINDKQLPISKRKLESFYLFLGVTS